MSRFSKIPVKIPETVKVEVKEGMILVSGSRGNLERHLPKEVKIEMKDGNLLVKGTDKIETKYGKSIVGTIKSHIANMIKGVTEGWTKKLEINGTGYRAEIKGNDLVLTVGFSHQLTFTPPQNVKFLVEKNVITVEGIDKEVVTLLAAKIRSSRKPDPYKGKGIRYLGEVLKLKPGKQAAKTGAA